MDPPKLMNLIENDRWSYRISTVQYQKLDQIGSSLPCWPQRDSSGLKAYPQFLREPWKGQSYMANRAHVEIEVHPYVRGATVCRHSPVSRTGTTSSRESRLHQPTSRSGVKLSHPYVTIMSSEGSTLFFDGSNKVARGHRGKSRQGKLSEGKRRINFLMLPSFS